MDQRHKWMVTARFEKRALLIAVNCLAGMSIFFFGYDQGMMGGVNNAKHYIDLMRFGYVDDDGVPVVTDTLLQGGIMSVFYLGTLVGCMVGGSIGDRFGRIKTIAIGALWGIFGASLQCSSMDANWMIGSRLVNAIGTGILNGIVPVWASELADYTSRGSFIAMEFTLNIFGVVVAYWLGYGVSFIDNGEHDEALYILQRLRGTGNGIAEAELSDIQDVLRLEDSSEGTGYHHMLFGLKSGKLHTGRRVQLVIWLQIIQCWTGIAGITMYGPTIFYIAGFGPQKALWVSGLNNIFYMFATLICVFIIDKIGRRWTLYWGSTAQAVSMFLVGGLSRGGCCKQLGSSSSINGLSLHKHLRSDMAHGAVAVPKTLTLVLPYIVGAINENAMYIFAAVNVISIPIVWALYPESNQRTLEEMDFLFAANTRWTWDTEKKFKELKEEHRVAGPVHAAADGDVESKLDDSCAHVEKRSG
ncbi:hypothetical protein COL922a_010940 [Colletotrichum nupharicola]|nr:hypothetical protein COL922a_010940 [Colletotrichum nupharicola]